MQKLFIISLTVAATVLCVCVTLFQMHQQSTIRAMVKDGADPIAAFCSLGSGVDNSRICTTYVLTGGPME